MKEAAGAGAVGTGEVTPAPGSGGGVTLAGISAGGSTAVGSPPEAATQPHDQFQVQAPPVAWETI